jgi:hypothetical protein
MDSEKVLINEELSAQDIKEIKEMINNQLKKLFYTLYVKKMFWDK